MEFLHLNTLSRQYGFRPTSLIILIHDKDKKVECLPSRLLKISVIIIVVVIIVIIIWSIVRVKSTTIIIG